MSKVETTQIVVPGVPIELVRRLEKIAKRDNRSRAAEIRVLLEEIVAARERQLEQAAA